MPMQ